MSRRVGKTAKTRRIRRPDQPWTLEDAKANFGEVVRRARESGPQRVTVHGKETAVVRSAEEFAKLSVHAKYPTLRALMAPLRDIDLEFEPFEVTVRPVEL
jgi:prevent-host-death family protein